MGCCNSRDTSKKEVPQEKFSTSSITKPITTDVRTDPKNPYHVLVLPPPDSTHRIPESKQDENAITDLVSIEDPNSIGDQNPPVSQNPIFDEFPLVNPDPVVDLNDIASAEVSPQESKSSEDSRDPEILISSSSRSRLLKEAELLKLMPLEDFKDSHAETLLSYCEGISNWIPVKEVEWMTIEKLENSDFNKEYPMTHTQIRFPSTVPLALLLQQLNSDKHRPIWDTHVKHMEILSGNEHSEYFMYRTMGIMLYKADFVDKKIVGVKGEEVIVVGYGVEGQKEPVSGFTRAVTTLSIHKIRNEGGVTVLENYAQTDAKSQLAKAFAGLGPAKLIDWGKALIKRVKLLQGQA